MAPKKLPAPSSIPIRFARQVFFSVAVMAAPVSGRHARRGRINHIYAPRGAMFPPVAALAGVRAVELQGEVVHVGRQLHEGGGVGFHFAQQGALVDDLAARRVHHFAEGGDGGGEGGNAGGGHAAPGGIRIADGGAG
jgi:hypothetical protein